MPSNINDPRPYEQYLLTFTLLLISALLVYSQAAKRIDLLAYDTAINISPATIDENTVIIAIDEKSLNSIGQWPWRRAIHAQLIDKLTKYNAELIALDILFSERSANHPNDDDILARAIKNNGNVVLPLHLQPLTYGGTLVEILPIPSLVEAAKGLGHVHVDLDQDGLARGLYLNSGVGDAHWPSISMAMASEINPMIQYLRMVETLDYAPYMSVNTQYRLIPYAGPGGTFPTYSYLEVMLDQVPADVFRNKTVLIGATAAGLGDIIPTPVSRAGTPMSGVELHANAFSALMTNTAIKPVTSIWAYLLTFAFIMIPILVFPRLKPTHVMPFTVLLVISIILFSYALMRLDKTWFPPINSIIGILLAYPFWSWQKMRHMNSFLNTELERLDKEPAINFRQINQQSTEGIFVSLKTLLKPKNFVFIKNKKIVQQDDHTTLSYQKLKSRDKWFHEGNTSWISLKQKNGTETDNYQLGFSWEPSTNLKVIQEYLNKLCLVAPNTQKQKYYYEKIASRIAQVREAIQSMQDMKTFISKGFEEMPNAILVTDSIGTIVFCNSHAQKWFSYEGEPLISKPIYSLFDETSNPQLILNLGAALTIDMHSNDEIKIGNSDILVHITPFLMDKQSDAGLMVTLSEVTHIKEQQREKNQLIDFLSHDVRSPLVSQLALLDGIKTGRIEWQTKLIEDIENHAKRSLNISDQFLQITRAEQTAEQNFYEFDLLNTLENSIDSLSPIASSKDIVISFSDDEPVWIMGNAELMERAFTNLLSNAIKYSPNNTLIDISLEAGLNQVKLIMKDQGYGISTEELPYIFNRFQRQKRSEVQGEKGAGLGLNFVQLVITKHKGMIAVKSKIDIGTTFTLTLPIISEA